MLKEEIEKIRILPKDKLEPEMALSRDFGIGIFYFGLDRKFPEISCGKSRKDPEKIPISRSVGAKELKLPTISPGFMRNLRDWDFSWDGISRKKPTLAIIVMNSDL